jgi:2-polyprenyl-3-methyl-5-hydroxy-6-metoxy-1,4-benzoquinol methylase
MTFKDRFYQSYTSTHVNHRKGEAALDRFRAEFGVWEKHFGRLLPRNREARILDVGCGRGGMVFWLQQRGYPRAEGVDLSREQVETARRLGIPNVQQADLSSYLGSRPGFYDALILRDVVEHFTREQIVEVLQLCRAAIRPGGSVIVQVPNAESPFFGRIRSGDFTHELAYTSSSVTQLFNVVGFDDPQVYPTDPAIAGLGSLGRAALWAAVKTFYRILLFAELGRGQRILTQGLIAVGQVPAGPAAAGTALPG